MTTSPFQVSSGSAIVSEATVDQINVLEKTTLTNHSWHGMPMRDDHLNGLAFSVRGQFVQDAGNPRLNDPIYAPKLHLFGLSVLSFLLTEPNGDEFTKLKNTILEPGVDVNMWGLFANRNTTSDPKRMKLSQRDQQVLIVGGIVDIPNIWGRRLTPGTKLYIAIAEVPDELKKPTEFCPGIGKRIAIPQFELVPSTESNQTNVFYVGKVMKECPPSFDGKQDTFRKISRSVDEVDRLSKVTLLLNCKKVSDFVPRAKVNVPPTITSSLPQQVQSSAPQLDLQNDESIERYVGQVMASRSPDQDLTNVPHVTSYLKTKVRQEGADSHRRLLESDLNTAFHMTLEIDDVDKALKRYTDKETTSPGWKKVRDEKMAFLPTLKGFIHRHDWDGFLKKFESHYSNLVSIVKSSRISTLKSLQDEYTPASLASLEGTTDDRFYKVISMERAMARIYSKN